MYRRSISEKAREAAKNIAFPLVDKLPLKSERLGRARKVVYSVKEWLEKRGRSEDYIPIRPPSLCDRQPPEPHDPLHGYRFRLAMKMSFPEFFVAKLKGAYVSTGNGFVLTADRRLLYESLEWHEALRKTNVLKRSIWPKVERLSGSFTAPIHHFANGNYAHWLTEVIPRLQPFTEERLSHVQILLPPTPSTWMMDSLEALGIDRSRLYVPSTGQVQVETLYFASVPGVAENVPRWSSQWLREQFSPEPQTKEERIFIDRSKAGKREVKNKAELDRFLSEHGFEKHFLEDISFREQRDLFRQAEAVIAPHGAGNANISFSHDLRFIELFSPSWIQPRFFAISDNLGHAYRYLMCAEHGGPWQQDIVVDVERLERVFEDLMEQPVGAAASIHSE